MEFDFKSKETDTLVKIIYGIFEQFFTDDMFEIDNEQVGKLLFAYSVLEKVADDNFTKLKPVKIKPKDLCGTISFVFNSFDLSGKLLKTFSKVLGIADFYEIFQNMDGTCEMFIEFNGIYKLKKSDPPIEES